MRILLILMIVTLLSACCKSPTTNLDSIKVITGTKCTTSTPTTGACPTADPVGYIELDAQGNPSAVNDINSCEGKKVTWKYKKDYANGDAPPFLVIFDPATYPGNSYKVLSKPKPSPVNAENQEFTLNTRKVKSADGECLNYAIMIPGKDILDPVFIIKK